VWIHGDNLLMTP
jgi:trehalose 6-phosphate synthase/phosphatase